VKKRLEPVLEVEGFLQELRDAWAEMIRKEDSSRMQDTRGVA